MAIGFTKDEGTYEQLPEGSYILRWVGVAETRQFDDGLSMWVQFVVDDENDDWDGSEVRSWYPQRMTPNNKTTKLMKALFGGELPDQEYDSQGNPLPMFTEHDLVGKKFRGTVVQNEKGYNAVTAPVPLARGQRRGAARGQQTLDDAIDDA